MAALSDNQAPAVVQAVTHFLPGDMKWSPEPARPRDIVATARVRGSGGMGIRTVQAGVLTDRLDRDLPKDHPAIVDFHKAQPIRRLAAEPGESPASLADRYALTTDGVDTVVLRVKNRTELSECPMSAKRGLLPENVMRRIDDLAG
ncbi:MAG TPA: aldo/keto reductase [Acidimicrobiia bacterium]|nr:aldo/keto reductase [Acidimicrobiia bacterium]